MRNASTDGGVGVILGGFRAGDPVQAARDALDGSLLHETPERAGMDAQFGGIASTEERPWCEVLQVSHRCLYGVYESVGSCV